MKFSDPRKFALILLPIVGGAQPVPSEPKPVFDAASVKLSAPGPVFTTMQGGPGTADPGRITYRGISLRNVLAEAGGVRYDAVRGPAWLDSVRVDIVATMPRGADKKQFRLMLLHLLEERFKFAGHFGTELANGYALVVAKNSPKLRPATAEPITVSPLPQQSSDGPPKVDEDGFPLTAPSPGVQKVCIAGGCRFRAISATMQQLANQLPCQCRIVDETHLSGEYDFVLTADVLLLARPALQAELAGVAQPERKCPDIFSALEKQLGLKLERKKVPSDTFYVDHIDKVPTEN